MIWATSITVGVGGVGGENIGEQHRRKGKSKKVYAEASEMKKKFCQELVEVKLLNGRAQ